ncbi:hypothetical protein [Solirubrobacter soli]|uniref:hypothetical protein n=1 Tax=Solirubrobacter soli TaxID=363832 RepID=UPI000414FFB8|nr:hypothetical protein [Solirubrobacter soli]
MRVDTSLLQGITAANQSSKVTTASLKSSGTTTSFSSQLKAATEKETTKPVPGTNYAEILTGPRAGLYLNTSGGPRDGEAFVLVKHDGAEDHIYGTGDDRKVIRVSADKSDSDSSDSGTSTKTSNTTGSTSTDKAPAGEKTKQVDGRAYADITSGPRKDLYLNTSGNARDGKTFVLVKKDDREYHIYGTGKNREIFMVKDPTAKTADTDTNSSSTTDSTASTTDGTTANGSLVTSNPTSS